VSTALVRTGVVTVCCGGHRPTPDCPCCLECPCQAGDPAVRALLASGARAHDAALRMALRRAFHLVTAAGIKDDLRDFDALSRLAVDVAGLFDPDGLNAARDALAAMDLLHFEGSLT